MRLQDLGDQTLGTFNARLGAIQAAAAVSSGRFGQASGVLSEENGGELLPTWQVERDAYSKPM